MFCIYLLEPYDLGRQRVTMPPKQITSTNDWAEVLLHIINCMNLEQFQEGWEDFCIITNFIYEIPFLTAWNAWREDDVGFQLFFCFVNYYE